VSGAEERLRNDPTSELWGEHRARYRFAMELLQPGQRVLDVACGAGFGLELLAHAGFSAIGVDYDRAPLAQMRQPRSLVQADATRLPFNSHSADVVVSFETLEHVHDATALVAEFRRVLKSGGQLILSTPNRAFRESANPFHIREFTADELRALLHEHFENVQLLGQRPSEHYRYVPFLMTQPVFSLDALAWKVLVRLPFAVKNRIALALGGRPFYPGEMDYCFDRSVDGVHALLAIAQ
jgi:ubiquinone/menaquinone biosynthesis C-methylase UbiE